ncbi:MAG: metallophosphoesterase [Clostridiales bacterium]|nr:metallophosphoesterase [Clostridiales bacterium]
MHHRKSRRWLYHLFGALALPISFLANALYRGLTTVRYALRTDKLANGQTVRIALLTDLHDAVHGENQSDLIDRLRGLAPDLILLSGDMCDDVSRLGGASLLMPRIAPMAPCYYVTGSHDLYRPDIEQLKQSFRALGVRVLEGDCEALMIRGARLTICGLDDPTRFPRREERRLFAQALSAFQSLPADTFNILVAHRPDYIDEYQKLPVDLVVSGHAHGGQVRMPPLVNGLYAPNQGLFPRYDGGLYRVGGVSMAVSRGLSYHPALPRVFNPPELVVIDLSGGPAR